MATVEEILKQTGLTDEQIKALDPKITEGFTKVISTAAEEHEKAENARRLQSEAYDKEIAPALDAWANDKAALDAKMAAYEAALKSAAEGGFKVPDILKTPPTTTVPPTRTADGRFVAGANEVPGSPKFFEETRNNLGTALASMLDVQWKYQTLYGSPLPDSPTTLIKEATAQRMDPIQYIAKKYDFAGKEAAKRVEEQKKHDDAIRAETAAAKDKEWAEKVGNNPNIRQAEVSRFSDVKKAVKDGTRKDPLTMTPQERDLNTRQAIREEIAARESVH